MPRLIRLLCLATLLAAPPALAQDQQRIVTLVNDEVISLRDIDERMRIIMATARLPDSPEVRRAVRDQALRSLVDERLQMQEAKRRNISSSQQEVDAAIAQVERQMNIPPGRFDEFAQRAGVDPAALAAQIRTELTWGRMVRSRLMAQSALTERDIDEAIAKLQATAGQTENLISEILVPVDSPDQEEPQRQTALRIVGQLRGGASFPALARQFSRGTTAVRGGEVGWVQPGTLADEVEAAIAQLDRGQVSDPIRTVGGYLIVLLQDRRRSSMPGAEEAKVTLSQILLPLPANPTPADIEATMALARTVQPSIASCADVEPLAKELRAPGSGSLGTLRIADLPPAFRQAVLPLQPGATSEPVAAPRAVHLFTVCGREDAPGIDRNQVRQQLLMRRAELLAQRYIRELRRDATIEFR